MYEVSGESAGAPHTPGRQGCDTMPAHGRAETWRQRSHRAAPRCTRSVHAIPPRSPARTQHRSQQSIPMSGRSVHAVPPCASANAQSATRSTPCIPPHLAEFARSYQNMNPPPAPHTTQSSTVLLGPNENERKAKTPKSKVSAAQPHGLVTPSKV